MLCTIKTEFLILVPDITQQPICSVKNLELGELKLPELIWDVVQLQRETAVRQAAVEDHCYIRGIHFIYRYWHMAMIRILGNASVKKVLVQTFFFLKHTEGLKFKPLIH
jgi:hypothetical protein